MRVVSVSIRTAHSFNSWGGFNVFQYVEILSAGWKTGARTRCKKLHIDRALAYVNKLHIGGWISEDEYDTLYSRVDTLITLYQQTPEQYARDVDAWASYTRRFNKVAQGVEECMLVGLV